MQLTTRRVESRGSDHEQIACGSVWHDANAPGTW